MNGDLITELRERIAELEAELASVKLAHSGLSNGNYSLRKELAAAQAEIILFREHHIEASHEAEQLRIEVKRLQAECMQLRKGIDGYCTCNRLLAVDCPVHDK